MRTTLIIKEKKIYNPPQVEMIRLDNEISLQLGSGAKTEDADPTLEPGGSYWGKANHQNIDPYKMA